MASSIYFVQGIDSTLIKIGFAKNLRQRLCALRSGSPDQLHVLGITETDDPRVEERALHVKFAHLRMAGEWFRAAPELLRHIAAHTEFYYDDEYEETVYQHAIKLARWAYNPAAPATTA